jgi:hypothetical protein
MKHKIGYIVLLIVFLLCLNQCNKYKVDYYQSESILSAIEDTLKTYRGKDNLNRSKISVLETDNVKSFLDLKSKDREIIALQEIVNKYKKQLNKPGSSATRFISTTTIKDTVGTVNQSLTPISNLNDSIFIHYNLSLKDDNGVEWVYGSAIADNKYLLLDQKIVNEYSVIIGNESQGWFKRPKSFVEVLNHNPFSETTSLRTYRVTQNSIKRFGVGPGVYYGIGSNFQPQVFIGIGIQYNFIRF